MPAEGFTKWTKAWQAECMRKHQLINSTNAPTPAPTAQTPSPTAQTPSPTPVLAGFTTTTTTTPDHEGTPEPFSNATLEGPEDLDFDFTNLTHATNVTPEELAAEIIAEQPLT